MRIELRILSGARAGQSEVFEQPTILVGRKPTNDLCFDTHGDLDVSGQHAVIREVLGRWVVVDTGSTNGTFINGLPAKGEAALKDGDIIAFGKNGPTVEVRAKGDATGKTPAIPRTDERKSTKTTRAGDERVSTHERVAIAVREQTRGIKTMLVGSMIGLGGLTVIGYWIGTREGSRQVTEMQHILAQAESTNALLQTRARSGDTVLARALAAQFDSLRAKAQSAASGGNEQQIAAVKQEIERNKVMQQGLAAMNYVAISAQNDNAVAFLFTELDGVAKGGTAFGVTKNGVLVTNRHNVRSDSTGAMTTRLEIQYANTGRLVKAHVIKVSEVEGEDLALIQVDAPGEYPVVSGISRGGESAVGAPLATIGFPLSLELPMQGNIMKTTLALGTTSKRIAGSLLQIDSYGAHGLSGAPVFDARGIVVGVVYGGPAENPQIIYAVPSDRLVAFGGDVLKAIVR